MTQEQNLKREQLLQADRKRAQEMLLRLREKSKVQLVSATPRNSNSDILTTEIKREVR